MTHDQHVASDPELSVWVSASAGTGKTKVLTDRVLRLLLSGAAPSKILCVTYTRAAAAEMEARISAQLAGWVVADDDTLARALFSLTARHPDTEMLARARRLFAHVLDAPERIRIQTIHGLCQSILTRFPLEAEVPPHFTLIDEITSRELMEEVKARLFAGAGNAQGAIAAAIAELAAYMSEAALSGLIDEIIHSRRKFESWQASDSGTAGIYRKLGLAPETTDEMLVCKHLHYTKEQEAALKNACAALAKGDGKTDRHMHAALAKWLESRSHAEEYARAFITQENRPRKQLCTKGCAKHLAAIDEILAAEQARVIAYHEECRSLFVAKMSVHVTTLAAKLLELYRTFKARRGYLDYDDLIFSALALLTRPGIAPWVLYKLDGGIDHLLVDEAQDTSPEQWGIIDALASEFFAGESARTLKRTLFIVGDEKQSIYSFQGAEPSAFDAVQRKLAKSAREVGREFRRVRLARSFRSAAPVLEAVDSVFARSEAREGLIFTESDIRHEVTRSGAAGRVELWPLMEPPPEEEPLPSWHIPSASVQVQRPDLRSAGLIADTIAGWLHHQRPLASHGRPVQPGDIMILVQRRSAFAGYLLRALKRRQVPVAGADRLVLTDHIAVEDCVSLGHFLLLPQDDLTLAEVLRSPFIGLSEEALFELAYDRDGQTLWQRLKNNSGQGEAYEYLSALLAKTDYLPPYELFAYILEVAGGRAKLASRLGDEIDDPLNEFMALAMEYDRTHAPSLQGFLHWLKAGDIEIKRDMEKGKNEVRILTVHSAKGLQAPIVFLPDTARIPPYKNNILWPQDEPMPIFSPGAEYEDRHSSAIKQSIRQDAEREYRRLLYVAMTRAEDELYISGWKNDREIAEGSWYELVRGASEHWNTDKEIRFISSAQDAEVSRRPRTENTLLDITLPSWVNVKAPVEPMPARPLSPSQPQGAEDMLHPFAAKARARGILIHRMLQYLPELAVEERKNAIVRFMEQRENAELASEDKIAIANEVLALLTHPEYAAFFAPGSVPEVSIAGVVGEENPITIAGRIDRLAVLEHAVYVIEYKTTRRVPRTEYDVPEAPLRQMDAYRQLIARIYPDKAIYCGILWTAGPKLIVLSDALMESLAA